MTPFSLPVGSLVAGLSYRMEESCEQASSRKPPLLQDTEVLLSPVFMAGRITRFRVGGSPKICP